MKKLFTAIFILLCSVMYGQNGTPLYPITQSIGSASTLLDIKGGARVGGAFVLGHYTDTTAANAVSYVKNFANGLITTDTNQIWLRTYNAQRWVQLFLNNPATTSDTLVWKQSGNYVADRVVQPVLGTKTFTELPFITNDTTRMTIGVTGIRRTSSAQYKYVMIDTASGGNFYLAYGDGGSGSTPTLQQVLTAGSTLTGDNTIAGGGFNFDFENSNRITLEAAGVSNTAINVLSTNAGIEMYSSLNGGDNTSYLHLTGDSVSIYPNLGRLSIDTLNYTLSTTGKKILLRDTATGLVQNIDASLIGGGSSLTYSANPSAWLTQKSVNNPVINSDMYTPNPVTEHTQYAPSPIIAGDGNVWVYVKGDATNGISVYKSLDRGESFTFIDTVIMPTPGTYYSASSTIPGAVADSANNLIHLYFQAMPTGTTPNVFSIGKSSAPFSDPSNITVASTPLITPADFVTQTGISFQPGYLNITSVVKTDSIYFFGTFWDGNADNPAGDFKIFMGSSINYDTIRNCRVILSPTAPYDLVRSPTVFSDNGLYKMIYTNGYIDNDSLTDLVSAYSADLKTWTPYPGVLLSVGPAGSWEEKRVYMAQVLKKSTGTFAEPYFFPTENYGYPQNDNYTDAIKYYYSGSNFDAPPYHDYTGVGYLYPQRSRDDFFIAENDTNISVINRNTTHVINIPNATDSTTGKLKSSDWSLFNSKAPGSGSANYIQNKGSQTTPQASSSFTISDSAFIGKILQVGGSNNLYALSVNANAGTGNYAGMQISNSANSGKEYYWQISTGGEISHGGIGTSGSYTMGSFAGGMLLQSAYWRFRENQFPFNYIFEIDGAASNRIYAVPASGRMGVGTYSPDSVLTANGIHTLTGIKIDGVVTIGSPSLALGKINMAGDIWLSGGNYTYYSHDGSNQGSYAATNISWYTGSGTVGLGNVAGNLEIQGTATKEVNINQAGLDVDFRVEGDNDASLIVADAGNDKVGIGTLPTTKLHVAGRFASNQGADVASAAGAITLGTDGNTFEITGTAAVTLISNAGWVNGSEINLVFTSTATLTDGTANSGTDIGLELAGNTNFTASAGAVVKLLLSEIGGTSRWREVSRSIN